VLDHKPIHPFADQLIQWAEPWAAANPSVQAVHGPSDRDKIAAWVQADGESVGGQVTVWDSGECEVEVLDVATGQPRWIEHFEFASEEDMHSVLVRFMEAIDRSPE
jgi:hypothetical protein